MRLLATWSGCQTVRRLADRQTDYTFLQQFADSRCSVPQMVVMWSPLPFAAAVHLSFRDSSAQNAYLAVLAPSKFSVYVTPGIVVF